MTHALATRARCDGTHSVVAVCVVGDQVQVLLCADQRTRVAGKRDNPQLAEDRIDCAAFETELSEMSSGEERTGRLE